MVRYLLKMLTNYRRYLMHWILFSPGYCYVSFQPSPLFLNSFRVSLVICVSGACLFIFLWLCPFFLSGCSGWPGLLSSLAEFFFSNPVPSSSLKIGCCGALAFSMSKKEGQHGPDLRADLNAT